MKTLVVLISGNGSNLQAIIDAIQNGTLQDTKISLVISNRKQAYGLERARNAGIPTLTVSLKQYKDAGKPRTDFDADLAQTILARCRPDLVVLAGWMHILSSEFLSQFGPKQVINLHPALPGQFDGINAIERAFEAFQRGEIEGGTGVMVHYCIPEVDRGEVVAVAKVDIVKGEELKDLEKRIHETEHRLLIEGIRKVLEQ